MYNQHHDDARKICFKCHTESVAKGANFCSNCGHPLIQPCPTCGGLSIPVAALQNAAVRCEQCGQALEVELDSGRVVPRGSGTPARDFATTQLDWNFKRGPSRTASARIPGGSGSWPTVGKLTETNSEFVIPLNRDSLSGMIRTCGDVIVLTTTRLIHVSENPTTKMNHDNYLIVDLARFGRPKGTIASLGHEVYVAFEGSIQVYSTFQRHFLSSLNIVSAKKILPVAGKRVAVIDGNDDLHIFENDSRLVLEAANQTLQSLTSVNNVFAVDDSFIVISREGSVSLINSSGRVVEIGTVGAAYEWFQVNDWFIGFRDGKFRSYRFDRSGEFRLMDDSDFGWNVAPILFAENDRYRIYSGRHTNNSLDLTSSGGSQETPIAAFPSKGNVLANMGVEVEAGPNQYNRAFFFVVGYKNPPPENTENHHLVFIDSRHREQRIALPNSNVGYALMPSENGIVLGASNPTAIWIQWYSIK